jgi:hypothetical protein
MKSFGKFKFLVGKMVHIPKWEFRDVTWCGSGQRRWSTARRSTWRAPGLRPMALSSLRVGARVGIRLTEKRYSVWSALGRTEGLHGKRKGLGQLRRRGPREVWKIEILFLIFLIWFENQNEFYSNLNLSTQSIQYKNAGGMKYNIQFYIIPKLV